MSCIFVYVKENDRLGRLVNKMTSIDFTRTGVYEDLYRYWANEDYTLEAEDEGGSWESIDRDQAVDDEGVACYTSYAFVSAEEAYRDPSRTFAAEQVEWFAQTW